MSHNHDYKTFQERLKLIVSASNGNAEALTKVMDIASYVALYSQSDIWAEAEAAIANPVTVSWEKRVAREIYNSQFNLNDTNAVAVIKLIRQESTYGLKLAKDIWDVLRELPKFMKQTLDIDDILKHQMFAQIDRFMMQHAIAIYNEVHTISPNYFLRD